MVDTDAYLGTESCIHLQLAMVFPSIGPVSKDKQVVLPCIRVVSSLIRSTKGLSTTYDVGLGCLIVSANRRRRMRF